MLSPWVRNVAARTESTSFLMVRPQVALSH